jgi:hypothetical protein
MTIKIKILWLGNVYSEVVEALLMIDRTGELENYYFI